MAQINHNKSLSTKSIIITTISKKNSKHCVAGFEINDKKWCRIETDDKSSSGAVDMDHDLLDINDFCPEIGDVIKFWYKPQQSTSHWQPENCLLDKSKKIKILHSKSLSDIITECPVLKANEKIYLNNREYLIESEMSAINFSLIAANVKNFIVYIKETSFGNKCKCKFEFGNEKYDNISFTVDMGHYKNPQLEFNMVYENVFIVVSTGSPFDSLFYKFVSTAIPFKYVSKRE